MTDRQPGWPHAPGSTSQSNDTPGWVAGTDVNLGSTPYSIKVDLAAHELTVLDAGQVVLQTKNVI